VVDGTSAVYANTATDTNTVIRPTASGVESTDQLLGPAAPDQRKWTVQLPPNEHLAQVDPTTIAVVDSSRAPDPSSTTGAANGSATSPNPTADPTRQLQAAGNTTAYAQSQVLDGSVVATAVAASKDANGADVPTTLTADPSNNTVTMTISAPSDPASYPVIADPSWSEAEISADNEAELSRAVGWASFDLSGRLAAHGGGDTAEATASQVRGESCHLDATRPFKAGPDPGALHGPGDAVCHDPRIQTFTPSACIQKLHHTLGFHHWEDESCDNSRRYPFRIGSGTIYMQPVHRCVATKNTHTWRTIVRTRVKPYRYISDNSVDLKNVSHTLDSRC